MIIRLETAACIGVLSAALVGSWLGCSSSSDGNGATAADGGADAEPGGDASVDSAASLDAGEAGAADNIGAIFAISDTVAIDGGAKSSYRVGASFTHTTTPDGTTTSKTVGPCLLETIGDGASAKEDNLSAGVVHVAGGSKPIDLAPKGDNTYAVSTGSTSLWNGGEMLTVTGEGKDVPAFMTTLVAPSKITLSVPVVTAGSLNVSRSAGVSATFTGSTSGDVVFYFDTTTPQKAFAATCTFKATAGTAQIPAAAFADFPAGAGTFNFYVKESKVATPAGWYVRFTASKALVDGTGAGLFGQATFN